MSSVETLTPNSSSRPIISSRWCSESQAGIVSGLASSGTSAGARPKTSATSSRTRSRMGGHQVVLEGIAALREPVVLEEARRLAVLRRGEVAAAQAPGAAFLRAGDEEVEKGVLDAAPEDAAGQQEGIDLGRVAVVPQNRQAGDAA